MPDLWADGFVTFPKCPPRIGISFGKRIAIMRRRTKFDPRKLTSAQYQQVQALLAGGGGAAEDIEELNNAVALTSVQIEAPTTGTQLPFETFTLLSGSITANEAKSVFTLPQSDIPYVVEGTAGVDLDGNPGSADWSIELWNIVTGVRLPGSTNATASSFSVTGTQSGYQYYQPNMMAVVDASAGPVLIGMVVTEGDTGSGGNTLDILDRTLEIKQMSQHVTVGETLAPTSIESWTGEVLCSVTAEGTEIPTGLDLTGVRDIWVHFRRRVVSGSATGFTSWPLVARVALRHVLRNIAQGYMILHFDNDYLSMILNDGDLANGILRFRSNFSGNDPGFRFEVTEIEFDFGGFIRGESAYEIAVRHGFVGTEQEWLNSLGAIL